MISRGWATSRFFVCHKKGLSSISLTVLNFVIEEVATVNTPLNSYADTECRLIPNMLPKYTKDDLEYLRLNSYWDKLELPLKAQFC